MFQLMVVLSIVIAQHNCIKLLIEQTKEIGYTIVYAKTKNSRIVFVAAGYIVTS